MNQKTNWKTKLENLSSIIHNQLEDNCIYYDKVEITNNWIGFDPASEDEINQTEERLQIDLPKSYKEFLKISNGFRQISHFSGDLLPVNKIDWIQKKEPEFCKIFEGETDEDYGLKFDESYYQYDENQRTERFKIDHLRNSIMISNWVDGSFIAINPKVKFGDEYEIWVYANWFPGAERFPSFKNMIDAKIEQTIELIQNKD